ncbi:hypothetical protein D9613_008662 [Agrocybe pediades]|uniref:Uncharacterized protein n=1 Tax=Agrocybe pediades TaxID=84607 RepID=A0A8H4QSU2_9AGAR|nr:hypothetical protein D9613_008662 [Agrocybe pediades]
MLCDLTKSISEENWRMVLIYAQCHLQHKASRLNGRAPTVSFKFLQMGGLMLHDKGRAKQVLGWETLMHCYYQAGRIDLSSVTEASINDHSKADGLAKGLALLQTFWFIVQCIARFSDKSLVLTGLELATAALAVLSLIMYLLWWNKPFNAQIPIPITLLPKPRVDDRSLEESISGLEPYAAAGVGHKPEPLLIELKEAFMSCRHILKRIVEIQTNGFLSLQMKSTSTINQYPVH